MVEYKSFSMVQKLMNKSVVRVAAVVAPARDTRPGAGDVSTQGDRCGAKNERARRFYQAHALRVSVQDSHAGQ